MPKRRASRSRRKRSGTRPPLPLPAGPAITPAGASLGQAGVTFAAATPVAAGPVRTRERAVTRFTARDYTYVRRELRRILIFATAIIIAIVVISFFLP